jgi:myosin heavy subunit
MNKNGVLTKLDDLCKLPKATDYTIIENFNNEFSKNPYYSANKRKDLEFSINHYAGAVTYTADHFLEKNRDSLPLRVVELLKNSKNDLISEIFDGKTNCFINMYRCNSLKFLSFFQGTYFKDDGKINDKFETSNGV